MMPLVLVKESSVQEGRVAAAAEPSWRKKMLENDVVKKHVCVIHFQFIHSSLWYFSSVWLHFGAGHSTANSLPVILRGFQY